MSYFTLFSNISIHTADKPSTTVTDQPTPNENKLLSLNEFAQESLKVHNILRRKHGASDLKLNDKLTVDAKK